MKRATTDTDTLISKDCYFNPRPREEGDIKSPLRYKHYNAISIHALVKRATCVPLSEVSPGLEISIHALVKRAT